MTITSDLQTVSKVKVGSSATYAVIAIHASTSIIQPANQTRASYTEIRWELECLAEIAAPTSIATLNDTLAAELAKVGEAVTLTEHSTDRIMPAQGLNGSLTGYPQTTITDIPNKSFAQFQAFTLSAITRIPIADANGLIEHTTETETITNNDGSIETSVRGQVRLVDGTDASAWVTTNIISPVRTAADAAGNGVVSRISVTDDTAHAAYSYSVKPGAVGSASVTEANVEDRTVKDISGRRVRTISGYAKGSGAAAFAASQRIAEGANLKIIREDGPSLPAVPDGRVNFNYQYVAGVTDAAFPGIFITAFKETISKSGGGRSIDASSYFTGDPSLRLGLNLPVIYTQSTQIEFIGPIGSHGLGPILSTNNISGEPRERRSSDGQINTVAMDWRYVFDSPLNPMPSPRSINGLA
ncbi:MAG: hypothetical protein ACWA5W_02350 [Phycisphaerales bacterium]